MPPKEARKLQFLMVLLDFPKSHLDIRLFALAALNIIVPLDKTIVEMLDASVVNFISLPVMSFSEELCDILIYSIYYLLDLVFFLVLLIPPSMGVVGPLVIGPLVFVTTL